MKREKYQLSWIIVYVINRETVTTSNWAAKLKEKRIIIKLEDMSQRCWKENEKWLYRRREGNATGMEKRWTEWDVATRPSQKKLFFNLFIADLQMALCTNKQNEVQ